MIAAVDASEVSPTDQQWLNERHYPQRGVVVVHTPPGCIPATLGEVILHALGRPVLPGASMRKGASLAFSAAWLATALPRADLVVFAAERLREDALDWLSKLGNTAGVNVWLLYTDVPEGEPRGGWAWSLFAASDWHVRSPFRDRPSFELPPFPQSLTTKLTHDQQRIAAVAEAAYSALRRSQLSRLITETKRPQMRNVAAALVLLGLTAATTTELTVMTRLLEHDVFMHGRVLRVDLPAIAEVINEARDVEALADIPENPIDQAPDPTVAAQAVLALANGWWSGHPADCCDVASDGSHVLRLDGERIEMPIWFRWPLRAIAWEGGDETVAPTNRASVRPWLMYDAVSLVPGALIRTPRNALEPLTSRVVKHVRLEPYGYPTTELRSRRPLERVSTSFGPRDAAVIMHLRTSLEGTRRRVPMDWRDVKWLEEHRLVDRGHGGWRLNPVLLHAVQPDVAARGPELGYLRTASPHHGLHIPTRYRRFRRS